MLQRFVAFSGLCCKGLSYFSKAVFRGVDCRFFGGGFRGGKKIRRGGIGEVVRSKQAQKKPRAFWNAELARFKEFFYAQKQAEQQKRPPA